MYAKHSGLSATTLLPSASLDVANPAADSRSIGTLPCHHAGKDPAAATGRDWFLAAALLTREALAPRWIESRRQQSRWQGKRVYYLSMEFMLGRLLTDTLRNLGLYKSCNAALAKVGLDLEDIAAEEVDPALGNGGLGRLAACLMDSMASSGSPPSATASASNTNSHPKDRGRLAGGEARALAASRESLGISAHRHRLSRAVRRRRDGRACFGRRP